jgi:hypothetical protein
MNKETHVLALIPFAGFYCTNHDSELDFTLDQMFTDDSGNPNHGLVSHCFDKIKWWEVHVSYATAYVERFAEHFEIPSMKFESLSSPREYNFTTDRIFVEVSREDIKKVFDQVDRAALDAKAAEMFTSRSGFISFYSPKVSSWGSLDEWDHNHLLCLFSALVGEDFDDFELMESDRCNGALQNWIDAATQGIERFYNISDYLRRREERA